MLTRIYDGPHMKVTAAGTINSGESYKVGNAVGVAGDDAAAGEDYALHLVGTFELAKQTGTAWTQGQKLFFDPATRDWETVGGDDVGAYAAAAAAAGDTTGRVCLSGVGIQ